MRYPWVDAYLRAKPGVTYNYQADWHWHRYYVADKMFAAVAMDEQGQLYCITVKLPVAEGELLRTQHTGVVPGYYMNKQHWNSVMADAAVDDDLLRTMLDHAWQTAFDLLTKKKQREILALIEGREQK